MSDDEICGEPTTDDSPCQRDPGWGRDTENGPCIDHVDGGRNTGNRTELEKDGSIVDLVAGELQNGATVPEACAEAGISTSAYHRYRDRGDPNTNDDPNLVFREFWEETTRARRIGAKRDRERLKDLIADQGDTRTWYKLHHDQYGDTYDEEGGDGEEADSVPLVVPDVARPDT